MSLLCSWGGDSFPVGFGSHKAKGSQATQLSSSAAFPWWFGGPWSPSLSQECRIPAASPSLEEPSRMDAGSIQPWCKGTEQVGWGNQEGSRWSGGSFTRSTDPIPWEPLTMVILMPVTLQAPKAPWLRGSGV